MRVYVSKKESGFTLIELLIVVAIIAILAAIAIPNFLQAQVRAKIARVKADMRTIATGLETYAVDHNEYPFCSAIAKGSGAIEFKNSNYSCQHKFVSAVMTTPVAYLSSIPLDPFATEFEAVEAQNYKYNSLAYEKRRTDFSSGNPWPGPNCAYENRLKFLGAWAMWGCGPDLDRTDLCQKAIGGAASTKWYLGFYDPTNGTTSNGDIFRSQKHTNLGS